ncbi:MAG: prolipoprotein diacylglyceryl transferase [Desulfobacteraceae bacterium]|nr:prolipoprotein diacylglyceryl transferase [Desulfobacteraceae bacterium]
MFRYLGLSTTYPEIFQTVNLILYNGLMGIAVLAGLVLILGRLDNLGYSRKQQITLSLFTVFVAFPAGYLGSHAAGMFYQHVDSWSLSVFIENAVSGDSHTYHASIIAPAVVLLVFFRVMRYNTKELMDTILLYVPLGHAIGRVACLLIGCCWGRWIHPEFFGVYLTRFPNPVPLYAIFLNIGIFFVLRRLYENIYRSSAPNRAYGGIVAGAYLLLYGSVRMALEIFRTNRKFFLGLTQAQVVMAVFVLFGGCILIRIAWKNRRSPAHKTAPERELGRVLSLVGLIAVYLVMLAGTFHLRKMHVLPWPMTAAADLEAAWFSVLYYFPYLLFPVVSLFWVRAAGIPIWTDFRWIRFHPVLYAGLLCSIGYSLYLLVLIDPCIKGGAFWLPVVILSIMNATGEEFAFRQAFFRVLKKAGYGSLLTNGAQSLLYALPHFVIGGVSFGVFALVYGFLLGLVRIHTGSVTPCVICHFLIDIGCIGLPVLSC